VLALRLKAAALVGPIRLLIRGNADGWSARMLRLIVRFRKSVHQAR